MGLIKGGFKVNKLLLAILLILPMTTIAENWLNISEEDESPYYFDKDSIKSRYNPDGDLIVSMWTMYPSEHPIMEGTVANQMLNYANCSDMSLKHAEMLELDGDGNILWRLSQFKSKVDLSSVIPLDYYYPKSSSEYSLNLEVMCNKATIELGFKNANS